MIFLKGFVKKSQRIIKKEIEKAIKLMDSYYAEQNKDDGNKKWKDIKDTVYGQRGTERRDELERDFGSFKIGLLVKEAREQKHLT